MEDDKRFPSTLTILWCTECGRARELPLLVHPNCPGTVYHITYAPVIDVRDHLKESAALTAGTGHPGDVLLSMAMYQALDVIDKAYPVQMTKDDPG